MEYFEKKITYLRGLCDGSDFPAESKEGKIFHGILDVLDDMAFMLETFMDDEDLVMEDENLDETDEPIFFYSFNCPSCGQELVIHGNYGCKIPTKTLKTFHTTDFRFTELS